MLLFQLLCKCISLKRRLFTAITAHSENRFSCPWLHIRRLQNISAPPSSLSPSSSDLPFMWNQCPLVCSVPQAGGGVGGALCSAYIAAWVAWLILEPSHSGPHEAISLKLSTMYPNVRGRNEEEEGAEEEGAGSAFVIEKYSLCESISEPKMYLVIWLWEVEALNNESPLRGLNNMNKV